MIIDTIIIEHPIQKDYFIKGNCKKIIIDGLKVIKRLIKARELLW
jgi:hypothetical protein